MTDRLALRARRLNGLPAPQTASGPLPKRILTSRWTWVGVAFTLLYIACLAWQYAYITAPVKVQGGEVPGLNFSAIRDAAKLAYPTLLVWIVLYVLLDRFRPQRPLFWWLAVGWGGSVATGASLLINTWAAQQMQIAGQDPSSGARSAVFVAPFVEEATKASILFLIAVAYRYRLVSKISGIVLAGLSAAGFAFTENIIYYARAIVFTSTQIGAGDPDAAVHKLVMLRGVFLAFGHPLFTTMTGIGLIVALRTHSKVVRVLAPLVGYLVAALGHMSFNMAASVLQSEQQQYIVYFLLVLPLVLSVVIWILRQQWVEGRRLHARLGDYVAMGWLSEADAYVFSRERSRWRATFLAATRGWRCLLSTLALQRAVTELAYLRDAQVRGTVDAVGDGRARELLDRIRSLRPEAIDDPRGRKANLPDVRALVRAIRARLPGRSRPSTQAIDPGWGSGPAPVGAPGYAPVDPRWGPPRP